MEIKHEIKNGSGIKISAVIGNKEVGRAYLYILHNSLHKKAFGFIEDVFVDENYRGKGIGKKIVKELIKNAKEKGCYKLICTSRYAKEKAHKFYKNFGFKDYGKEFRMNL